MPNSALGNTALPTWDWHLNQLQRYNKDQWHPASQRFIPYSGSLSSYFPCISSMSYHHKPSTLQSKLHLPFLMFHYQILFPGLLLAVLSFLLACHDRTVSITFSSVPCYWSFFFLLFSLVSSLTSWRPSSFLIPSPPHVIPVYNSCISLSFPLLPYSLLISPLPFLLLWFFCFLSVS